MGAKGSSWWPFLQNCGILSLLALRSLTASISVSALFGFLVVLASCETKTEEGTLLQPEDLQESAAEFDANKLVEDAAFEDWVTIDAERVQGFFSNTPYGRKEEGTTGRESFLQSYQSNGIRASDAVVQAARKHRINPLALLARSQITAGLVGERFYPAPPARVEYLFGCGCDAPGRCDPIYAGFDRQIECLARDLRRRLDEHAAKGATAGQWGKDRERTSLDGEPITPANAATAVLYDYDPVVGRGKGGNWLFWNVWQAYADVLGYEGPDSNASKAWIGEACKGNESCGFEGGVCATQYTGGFCTVPCRGPCPKQTGKADAVCAQFPDVGGFCLQSCNPSAAAPCRPGYQCKGISPFGGGPAAYACVGQPTGGSTSE